jgi:hypothetical protein
LRFDFMSGGGDSPGIAFRCSIIRKCLILMSVLAACSPNPASPNPAESRVISEGTSVSGDEIATEGDAAASLGRIGARGCLVLNQLGLGVSYIALPTLDTRRLGINETSRTFLVSGPDDSGNVLYVVSDGSSGRVAVCSIKLDGSGYRELVNRKGDVIWDKSIGDLAISPIGGWVAFSWNDSHLSPPSEMGSIEIMNIYDVSDRSFEAAYVGGGMSWFPDGRRLAIVQLVAHSSSLCQIVAAKGFQAGFDVDGLVPIVSILDVESGLIAPVHVGLKPLVSLDGSKIMLSDAANRYWVCDMNVGEVKALKFADSWFRPIGWSDDDSMVYWAAQPNAKVTEYGSPISEPRRLLRIRIGRIGDSTAHTIVENVDPRSYVSYGLANIR